MCFVFVVDDNYACFPYFNHFFGFVSSIVQCNGLVTSEEYVCTNVHVAIAANKSSVDIVVVLAVARK